MTESLTTHDLSILEKIKDPEAGPAAPLLIDADLPRDPHITDPALYQTVIQREREAITAIQSVELQLAGLQSILPESPLAQYLECVRTLDGFVADYPQYASARNNRAQALRRIYGDAVLVKADAEVAPSPPELDKSLVLDPEASESKLVTAASTILDDLTTAIALLTPANPFAALSPQASRTLSQAYTQRGAIYHLTAKQLSTSKSAELRVGADRREARWTASEFEENASRDFMLGGRYGNEIAKALAVSTNPTAKLCGEMVKEAMRKEYAGETA